MTPVPVLLVNQGLMYKASPPFGTYDNRHEAIAELKRQLAILEDLVDPEGTHAPPEPLLRS